MSVQYSNGFDYIYYNFYQILVILVLTDIDHFEFQIQYRVL